MHKFGPLVDRPSPYPTLVQMAYDSIKKAIVESRLKTGEIYKEIVIAEELGMSKTPVHEALTKLSERGFIKILPRRGFQVVDLDAEPVSDLFEFRRTLERTVVFKVVPRLTKEELDFFHKLLKELDETSGGLEYQKADRAIHRQLAFLSGNRYFINALDGIWDLCDWIGMRILKKDQRLDIWKQHHSSIHRWMENRDAEATWKMLKEHLNHTENIFLGNIRTPLK